MTAFFLLSWLSPFFFYHLMPNLAFSGEIAIGVGLVLDCFAYKRYVMLS